MNILSYILLSLLFFFCVRLQGYEILPAENLKLAEKTALAELRNYLGQTVDRSLRISGKEAVIHLGDSEFARRHGINASVMPEENYVIRSIGNHLVLCGGGERGTLYAVYRFLEDVIGIHWFNQFEDSLPEKQPVALDELDIHWSPVFFQRDIYRSENSLPKDGGRFSARNRLNRDGDYSISPEYGGGFNYGSPYFIHTFALYFPEKPYFSEHPEYFALNKGKRVAGMTSQLCLTNEEMLDKAVREMRNFVMKDETEAAEKGVAPPHIYDFSINDARNPCECASCQTLVRREGSEAGPLLYAVNRLADEMKKFRPHNFVSTAAYYHTEEPPRSLRPRDNVIIRLCDTSTNQARRLSDTVNRHFVERLAKWAKIAPHIGIWDYGITYGVIPGPYPQEDTIADALRLYRKYNVRFVFFEHEKPETGDFYEMNLWLEARLLEDPDRDAGKLIRIYMDRCFGAAAPEMLAYRRLLKASVLRNNSYIDWFAPPAMFTHIDLATASAAQQLFDAAERKVTGRVLERVRRARVNLDRICMYRLPLLGREHFANGGTEQNFPLDRKAMSVRARDGWIAAVKRDLPPSKHAERIAAAQKEYEMFQVLPLHTRENPRFMGKKSQIHDFTAEQFQLWGSGKTLVRDSTADAGFAVRIPMKWKFNPENVLPCAMYVPLENKTGGGRAIASGEITKKGYQLYRICRIVPRTSAYLYLLPDWTVQVKLNNIVANMRNDEMFDVYVSARFSGPDFPFDKSSSQNLIFLERIILERVP